MVVVVVETGGSTTTPPGPATEVVIDPFSMYTPEKKKSSVVSALPLGSSRTPTCQSAPLEEVETDTAGTVRARGLEPVEDQRATVFAEKFCHHS